MPVPHIPESELLRDLEIWEAAQPHPPTIWDAIRSGSRNVTAAFVLRTFRIAAKQAVQSSDRVMALRNYALLAFDGEVAAAERFLRAPLLIHGRSPLEAAIESTSGMDEAHRALVPHLIKVAMRIFDMVAKAWELSTEENAKLLGRREVKIEEWRVSPDSMPWEVIERIMLLTSAHRALAIYLDGHDGASAWLRTATASPPFRAETALRYLMDAGMPGIRILRDYLEAETWEGEKVPTMPKAI